MVNTVKAGIRATVRSIPPLVLMLVLTLLVVPLVVGAYAWFSGAPGYAEIGCTCHGGATDPGTSVTITGIPVEVEPSVSYDLNITVTSTTVPGTTGGFTLKASVGTLATSDSHAAIVNGEATHANPFARSWTVQWTAPPGLGPVTFYVAGLASNGYGAEDDAYAVATYATAVVPEFPGATLLVVLGVLGIVIVSATAWLRTGGQPPASTRDPDL